MQRSVPQKDTSDKGGADICRRIDRAETYLPRSKHIRREAVSRARGLPPELLVQMVDFVLGEEQVSSRYEYERATGTGGAIDKTYWNHDPPSPTTGAALAKLQRGRWVRGRGGFGV